MGADVAQWPSHYDTQRHRAARRYSRTHDRRRDRGRRRGDDVADSEGRTGSDLFPSDREYRQFGLIEHGYGMPGRMSS